MPVQLFSFSFACLDFKAIACFQLRRVGDINAWKYMYPILLLDASD